MFTCFACKKDMDGLEALLSHIENHKIIKKKGIFQCTVATCWKVFDNWANFKKHSKRCYAKIRIDENSTRNDRRAEFYRYSYEEKLFEFEEAISEEMLKFICGLAANMGTPRKEVYRTVALLEKTFLAKVISGDTKEQNQRLGFCGSLSGNRCCRFCNMHIDDIRLEEDSDGATRRNIQNYDEDVATNDMSSTGIKEYSHFNRIPHFHVTKGVSVDIAHDLLEGILHPSLALSILHFIDKKYLDLKFINDRMESMDFGEMEKGNVPVEITLKKLKALKFKMTASKMLFFAHHLPLIIGNKIPEDDEVWQHVKTTTKFLDLCYRPEFDEQTFLEMKEESRKLNLGLKELFGQRLQHKAHLITHYDKLTDELGPLRYLQTIRYEGKHKEMKNYAKSINSRRNLPYSIGKKIQYNFAYRLLQKHGLEDVITVSKHRKSSLLDQEYYSMLLDNPILTELSRFDCFFARMVTINGITFSKELWLPDFESEEFKIYQVIDVVLLNLVDIHKIYLICKTYNKIVSDDHYVSYRVDVSSEQNELIVLNVGNYLTRHLYPVKIHQIAEDFFFRVKHF